VSLRLKAAGSPPARGRRVLCLFGPRL